MSADEYFSSDVLDFLSLLAKYRVRYLIVGGEAVIYHGHARVTGDIDLFYGTNESNVESLFDALKQFWNGDIPGVEKKDELSSKGTILQFGVPPNRLDLINDIEGIGFAMHGGDGSRQGFFIGENHFPHTILHLRIC